MDNICEQIVAKTRTGGDRAKAALIILGMALLAAILLFLAFITGFLVLALIAAAGVAGGIYLLTSLEVEYEYIITNNEMDIDKIIGRRKRKRMITVDLSRTEEFCVFKTETDFDTDTTVYATSGLEKDARFLVVNHKDYGKVGVIFNPNQRTREAILREFPHALRARIEENEK